MRKRLEAVVGVLAILGIVFAGGASVAQAAKPHPHILNAYSRLSRAQYILAHASHQLGGHRAAALSEVQKAIDELSLAIAVDGGTPPSVAESGTAGYYAGTNSSIHARRS